MATISSHRAFFRRIGKGIFLAQALVGPVELVAHAATCETHFHNVRNLGWDAGEGVRLGSNDEANLAEVRLLKVLHVLGSIVLFALGDA